MTFLIAVFAAWQTTALVRYHKGPAGIFEAFRDLLIRARMPTLAHCFYCLAVWTSVGVVLLTYELSQMTPIIALAVSGAVSLLERGVGFAARRGAPNDLEQVNEERRRTGDS